MNVRSLAALIWGAAFVACTPQHRSAPAVGPFVPTNPQETEGERVFFRFCHQCHPGGAAGLGPALNDKPLPEFALRTQIRAGVGAMPAFSPRDIPDRDVDALVAYVVALRKHGN